LESQFGSGNHYRAGRRSRSSIWTPSPVVPLSWHCSTVRIRLSASVRTPNPAPPIRSDAVRGWLANPQGGRQCRLEKGAGRQAHCLNGVPPDWFAGRVSDPREGVPHFRASPDKPRASGSCALSLDPPSPLRSRWKAVTPCASQHTTSPSIRQDRTLRWFTASSCSDS